MVFRVLVAGGREKVDYVRLRDALDAALVNRLPHVEIITPGGPGVPALAASYARSHGLNCRSRHPQVDTDNHAQATRRLAARFHKAIDLLASPM